MYLAEPGYGEPGACGKPTISVGAWVQYYLDTFTTVAEAVEATRGDPFSVIAPVLPNGRAAMVHMSLSGPTGDCAVIEYLDARPVIHHGSEYQVMTNSPVFDQQLALNAYWDLVGGNNMLPGTISAADRFVRLSYFLGPDGERLELLPTPRRDARHQGPLTPTAPSRRGRRGGAPIGGGVSEGVPEHRSH